jgi:hypothetical protein
MAPIVWAFGGALAVHFMNRQGRPWSFFNRSTRVKNVLNSPPVHPREARLTPGRVAVHGDLMANCIDPDKLKRAAILFNHEGLAYHAQALLGKAQTIHEMMHGAQAIVERCRAGDQHAMAMAKGIGEQARAGNKRAQVSAFLIENYSKTHPNNESQLPSQTA